MPYVIALDVGGTSVKSGIVAREGRVIGEVAQTAIDSSRDADTIINTLAQIVRQHQALLKPEDWLGIGVGFPSPFDYEKGIAYIKDLHKYESIYGMNIADALRERVRVGNRPIRFRNDAEAAIVGEYFYGGGSAYHRVIGITLGTGFGSSFLVDGVRQSEGEGVPPDGWLFPEMVENVNLRADDVFSRRGLEQLLRKAGFPSEIPEAAMMAREGDAAARAIFESFGRDMGTFLVRYSKPFRAEAILVLGGITGAFDLFRDALASVVNIPVLPAVRGSEAALLGAAKSLFDLL